MSPFFCAEYASAESRAGSLGDFSMAERSKRSVSAAAAVMPLFTNDSHASARSRKSSSVFWESGKRNQSRQDRLGILQKLGRDQRPPQNAMVSHFGVRDVRAQGRRHVAGCAVGLVACDA